MNTQWRWQVGTRPPSNIACNGGPHQRNPGEGTGKVAPTATSDVDLIRDRSLVELAQAGDISAFSELYARYFRRLVRFAAKRVGDSFEAEEIAQETFVRAWRALPDFGGERRFYPWITVIASRLCIDNLRRRGRVDVGEVQDTEFIDGAFERIDREGDLSTLVRALDRLNDRHREVLELREQRGWSYQHIADHYQVSIGTVEALLWRARRSLRREFLALCSSIAGLPVIRRFTFGSKGGASNLAALGSVGTVVALTAVSGGLSSLPAAAATTAPAAAAVAQIQYPTSPTVTGAAATTVEVVAAGTSAAHRTPGAIGAPTTAPPAGITQYASAQRLMTGQSAQKAGSEAPIQIQLGSGGPAVGLTPPVSVAPVGVNLGGQPK